MQPSGLFFFQLKIQMDKGFAVGFSKSQAHGIAIDLKAIALAGVHKKRNQLNLSPSMQTNLKAKRPFKFTFLAASCLLLLSAGFVQAQVADRPKVGPEQKKLEVFVGEWAYEGSVSETPLGPGGKFAGKVTFRMILDGLFLESKAEDKGVYGGKEIVFKGVTIQWFDPITKTYPSHSYDNDSFVNSSVTTARGNIWNGTGAQTDSKGKSYKTKHSSTLSSDGRSIIEKAEISVDEGKTWMPYWEDTMKRVSK
jgi:hypothetical protein